jgi:hypothetical protein
MVIPMKRWAVIGIPAGFTAWLLTRRAGPLRPAHIVAWWELRRPVYNAVVGAVGIGTAAVVLAVTYTCEARGGQAVGLPDSPLFAVFLVLVYVVMANVCYTGGWVAELLVARVWRVDTRHFGPIALALGTLFSILLTLAPACIAMVLAAATACRGLPGAA